MSCWIVGKVLAPPKANRMAPKASENDVGVTGALGGGSAEAAREISMTFDVVIKMAAKSTDTSAMTATHLKKIHNTYGSDVRRKYTHAQTKYVWDNTCKEVLKTNFDFMLFCAFCTPVDYQNTNIVSIVCALFIANSLRQILLPQAFYVAPTQIVVTLKTSRHLNYKTNIRLVSNASASGIKLFNSMAFLNWHE